MVFSFNYFYLQMRLKNGQYNVVMFNTAYIIGMISVPVPFQKMTVLSNFLYQLFALFRFRKLLFTVYICIKSVLCIAIPRRCHVCGSTTSASLCDTRTIYLGNLQTCPSGSDFCMTDIIHGAGGSVQIFKR